MGIDTFNRGVFDRVVPEVIFRLLDSSEIGVDVGAYVGQNTSAMALATGSSGRVIAFEPHPRISQILQQNCESWCVYSQLAPISVQQMALSDQAGEATLSEPIDFEENQGSSTLNSSTNTQNEYSVPLETLDTFFANESSALGLVKLDVEGHELKVLQGAITLLKAERIRDIIFEELAGETGEAMELLQQHDFHIWGLCSGKLGPYLCSSTERPKSFSHNFLASRDKERVEQRMAQRGWNCLRKRVVS
jgi:FkbM family methyltransferase